MTSKFKVRADIPEIMDDLNCTGEVVNQTLRELEFINRWLGGNKVTINGIKELIKDLNNPINIVDLGCGGGDLLKEVAHWGRWKKVRITLTGIDANPNIIAFAEANTKGYEEINFKTLNVQTEVFNYVDYDIAVATLFTHHFNNQELVNLLRILTRQTKIGVVINDLHRHGLAYYSIKILTQLFSKSAMVKYDAPVSVLRGFSRQDLESILKEAGIYKYELRWKWAFRWQLIIPSSLA